MVSAEEVDDGTEDERVRPETVLRGIEREADAIKRRELSRAFSKLDTNDAMTGKRREVIEAMADGIVDELLSAPTETLREAERRNDPEAAAAALRIFDPGEK